MSKNVYTLDVNEYFVSIQGEGKYMGTLSLFIRLNGCNLSCDFCDTKYASKNGSNNLMNINHVFDTIIKENLINKDIQHLVITGGEPMLQYEQITELIKKIYTYLLQNDIDNRITVTIETNGTLSENILKLYNNVKHLHDRIDILFSISPKRNKIELNKLILLLKNIRPDNWILKIVVGGNDDILFVENILSQLRHEYTDNVYIMPLGTTNELLNESFKYCNKLLNKYTYLKYSDRLQIRINVK